MLWRLFEFQTNDASLDAVVFSISSAFYSVVATALILPSVPNALSALFSNLPVPKKSMVDFMACFAGSVPFIITRLSNVSEASLIFNLLRALVSHGFVATDLSLQFLILNSDYHH